VTSGGVDNSRISQRGSQASGDGRRLARAPSVLGRHPCLLHWNTMASGGCLTGSPHPTRPRSHGVAAAAGLHHRRPPGGDTPPDRLPCRPRRRLLTQPACGTSRRLILPAPVPIPPPAAAPRLPVALGRSMDAPLTVYGYWRAIDAQHEPPLALLRGRNTHGREAARCRPEEASVTHDARRQS
jgi:hypothetical protein